MTGPDAQNDPPDDGPPAAGPREEPPGPTTKQTLRARWQSFASVVREIAPTLAVLGLEVLRAVRLRVNELLLRAYVRAVPSEQNRLYILTVVIGALCGLAAVAFHLSIRFVEQILIGPALEAPGWSWIPWTILTPAFGALACGALLHFVVPAARGSGIPQVKMIYAIKSGRVRLRDAVGKFFIGSLQIGSGSSLGREGPTVQICAGLASGLGRLFALSPHNLRRLIPVGAAAGIAAAFNAPIAAVTFTIEELVGDLDQTVLSGVVVAAALAAIIERAILGTHPVFSITNVYAMDHASSLLIYSALGVAAAGTSYIFQKLLLALRARFQRGDLRPVWAQPMVGGVVTGVLAAVAIGVLHRDGVTGGGYHTLGDALMGNLPLQALVLLFAMKIVATAFSYSSGGAGGIFAPTLFIGGMLGGAFGYLDRFLLDHPETQTGAFALVGMGAVFAGVIRAPITSILIIFEMTNGYSLILPLMIANSTAYVLARRWERKPIYEALLEQDGIRLPHKSTAAAALSAQRVEHAMTAVDKLVSVRGELNARSALERLAGHKFSAYPVLAEDGSFLGVVSEARLRRSLAEGAADLPISQLLRPRETLHAAQPLLEAVVRMNKLGVRQMAVVDSDDPKKLVGMFAMSDVIRAHAETVVEAEGPTPASEEPTLHEGPTTLTDIPVMRPEQSDPKLTLPPRDPPLP